MTVRRAGGGIVGDPTGDEHTDVDLVSDDMIDLRVGTQAAPGVPSPKPGEPEADEITLDRGAVRAPRPGRRRTVITVAVAVLALLAVLAAVLAAGSDDDPAVRATAPGRRASASTTAAPLTQPKPASEEPAPPAAGASLPVAPAPTQPAAVAPAPPPAVSEEPPVTTRVTSAPSALQWSVNPSDVLLGPGSVATVTVTFHNPTASVIDWPNGCPGALSALHVAGTAPAPGPVCSAVITVIPPGSSEAREIRIVATANGERDGEPLAPGDYYADVIDGPPQLVRVTVPAT